MKRIHATYVRHSGVRYSIAFARLRDVINCWGYVATKAPEKTVKVLEMNLSKD
jgi:hypothetical protein